ncbi:MAG: FGGY-family carbohydrate kinase [Saprospiraceae bacterium]
MNHILILDIGKTNKKAFVFDEDYRIIFEKTTQLPETTDEDGDPCEDLNLLTQWVLETWQEVLNDERFNILAANVTTYGASLVHLGEDGKPVLPLYNYLKPFPENLKKQFFDTYGGEEKISLETASPSLGSLNSGLQLYRLKYEKPADFQKIKSTLHLPQYIACLLRNVGRVPNSSDVFPTELTSIGCHTMLWDFEKKGYHHWVIAEGLDKLFSGIIPAHLAVKIKHPHKAERIAVGPGLHDSSAALIPYRESFKKPFVLISTGTWNISLNPFNPNPLTPEELRQDCLCYLTPSPTKASRLFAGYEHEQAVKKIAAQFGVSEDFYKKVGFNPNSPAESAYLDFMRELLEKQVKSTKLVLQGLYAPPYYIFVDGGFSKNEIFMNLLARAFPNVEVFAAEVAQATALGAALPIHRYWNKKPIPDNLISLKKIRV